MIQDSVYHKNLLTVLADFWSIIPLHGYGQGRRPKQPRVMRWKQYQKRLPNAEELESWFYDKAEIAYGIIMGKVSGNLFGVDLDRNAEARYEEMLKKMPACGLTLRVATGQGIHLYFRNTESLNTQRFEGGELIGEGAYLVGPGSRLRYTDGRTVEYRILNKAEPYKLNQAELQQLKDMLGIKDRREQGREIAESTTSLRSQEQLISYYCGQARPGQRNNALHRAARWARQQGYSQAEVSAVLAEIYAATKGEITHPQESQQQRLREAGATIASAYKAKNHSLLEGLKTDISTSQSGVLPNSVREALMQLHARDNAQGKAIGGSTAAARLIEILIKAGKAPGTWLTAREMEHTAQEFGMGERQVWEVLQGKYAKTNTGRPIFRKSARDISYSDKDKPPAGDSANRTLNENYNSLLNVHQAKYGKQGRPPSQFYQIPSVEYLCQILSVRPIAWDMLSKEDLRSASAYRQALFREYLLRVRCQQSTAYLASIWSCHPRTIQRYDQCLEVVKRPCIARALLHMGNVQQNQWYLSLRKDGISPGYWLEVHGKRYPAQKKIALKLLKERKPIYACRLLSVERLLSADPALANQPIYRSVEVQSPSSHAQTIQQYPQRAWQQSIPREEQKLDFTKQNLVVGTDKQIMNGQLSLIKGLGPSRIARLEVWGIRTMTELIAAGSALGQRYWPGGYVSEKTVGAWIEEARCLLGLTGINAEKTAIARARTRRKTYSAKIRQFISFFKAHTLVQDPSSRFGRFFQRLEEDWKAARTPGTGFYSLKACKSRLGEIITFIQSHVSYFFEMSQKEVDWLARWQFESQAVWRRRWRRAVRLLDGWKQELLMSEP